MWRSGSADGLGPYGRGFDSLHPDHVRATKQASAPGFGRGRFAVLGLDLAAAVAGLGALINAVLVIARWRLSVLPNPGEGLPGVPVEH